MSSMAFFGVKFYTGGIHDIFDAIHWLGAAFYDALANSRQSHEDVVLLLSVSVFGSPPF